MLSRTRSEKMKIIQNQKKTKQSFIFIINDIIEEEIQIQEEIRKTAIE